MPSPNPFDDLMAICRQVLDAVHTLASKHDAARPEWEALKDAERTRRKGKRALIAACETGLIRYKRVPTRGGRDQWLLSSRDLDQHFPVQKK